MNTSPGVHVVARVLLAVVGGALLAAAFPPLGWWWVAPLAVAALTASTVTTKRTRGAFGLGVLGGATFFLFLLSWIRILGPDAWIALAVVCALWFGLLGVLTRVLVRLPYWPVWVAGAWIVQEALRDRIPYGGFPWGRLAYSQGDAPTVSFASLAGAALVTFVVALAGALLCWAALRLVGWNPAAAIRVPSESSRAPRLGPTTSAIGAVPLAIGLCLVGIAIPRPVDGQSEGGPASARVALIQGSVPGSGLNAMAERRAVLNNHVRETQRLAAQVVAGEVPAPELVIWPENSTDIDPLNDRAAREAISSAAGAIGVPILVGAVVRSPSTPGTLWNVGIVWDPVTGPGDYYVKRHPVPFGEYIPGRSVLQRFISRFDQVPYDFSPGDQPGVLQVGPALLADVICFEIAYDDVVRDAVLAGGRAISVQTNNATYTTDEPGGAAQSEQQAAMSQVRAVEHGRAVMIAATSGITAYIDPAGEVVEQAPLLEASSLVVDVPLRDSFTIADRVGHWPEWLVFLIVIGGVSLSVIRHRRAEPQNLGSGPAGDDDLHDSDG